MTWICLYWLAVGLAFGAGWGFYFGSRSALCTRKTGCVLRIGDEG